MNFLGFLLMAGPEGAEGGGLGSMIPFVLIFGIFYLFFIRPQQKKAKEAREFRANLEKGDKVVTIGGIHGKIDSLKDETIVISTKGGGKLEIDRAAISSAGKSDEMEMQAKKS